MDVDKETEEKFLTYKEAAAFCHRTQQALHVARNKGKFKDIKTSEGRRYIFIDELKKYLDNRFNRENTFYNGELLYDISKGIYPAKKAAEYLNVSYQHLYYHTRQGNVKYVKKGSTLIYRKEDLDEFNEWLKKRRDLYVSN